MMSVLEGRGFFFLVCFFLFFLNIKYFLCYLLTSETKLHVSSWLFENVGKTGLSNIRFLNND